MTVAVIDVLELHADPVKLNAAVRNHPIDAGLQTSLALSYQRFLELDGSAAQQRLSPVEGRERRLRRDHGVVALRSVEPLVSTIVAGRTAGLPHVDRDVAVQAGRAAAMEAIGSFDPRVGTTLGQWVAAQVRVAPIGDMSEVPKSWRRVARAAAVVAEDHPGLGWEQLGDAVGAHLTAAMGERLAVRNPEWDSGRVEREARDRLVRDGVFAALTDLGAVVAACSGKASLDDCDGVGRGLADRLLSDGVPGGEVVPQVPAMFALLGERTVELLFARFDGSGRSWRDIGAEENCSWGEVKSVVRWGSAALAAPHAQFAALGGTTIRQRADGNSDEARFGRWQLS